MSAIASSNSLGLVATSLPLINSAAGPNTGGSGEQLAVNVVNGNLVLQRQDELLVSKGLDTSVLRTYNSKGETDGDNNDNWRIGFYRSLKNLTGSVSAANSSIVRVAEDGAELTYRWNGSIYVNTDGDGSHDTLGYNATASQWTWTDGDSRVTETYDWSNGSGKLLSAKDMSGNIVSYSYQANGMLQQVLNASGEKTLLDYTGSNLTRIRVERTDGSLFSRVSYGYDSSNRLQSVTVDLTPDNAQDSSVYTTSYTYDGTSKRVRTVTQSDGSLISLSYDASNRVTSIADALGNITRYTYGTGQTTVTDALGNNTVYQYDADGRLGKITAPATGSASSVQQFSYNSNGDLLTITDVEGRRVVMQYDGNGNQILQRDEAGNTVTRTFDSGNRLLTETAYLMPDPDGADPTDTGTIGAPGTPLTTRYAYDIPGRLRFVISPEGRVTEHQYNAAGQRIRSMEYLAGIYTAASATEPELNAWATAVSKAQLQRTDMEYDFRGQLSRTTTYSAVDSAGTASGAAVTTYVYDQAGRLLSTIAPLGGSAQTTTYTYDGLDRLLVTTNGLGQQTIYSYDDAGNKTTVTVANGLKTISAYDKAGRLVSVQQLDASNADLGTSRYYYDNNHQLRMTEDATGVRTWMLYDAAGRRNGEIDGNGSLTEYVYDRNGQVTQTIRYATPVRAMLSPVMNAEIFTIANLGYPTLSAVGLTDTANGSANRIGAFTTATFGVENATKVSPLNVADPNLFAMRFTGSINVFAAGDYTFYTRSDDGSNLYIDGVLQVANDYAQAATTRTRTVYLGAGTHTLVETYYEWGGANTNEFGLRLNEVDVKAEQLVQIEQLRPAASASDQKTWNVYDSANRLIEQVAANGAVTEFQYDGQSRLVRTIEYATPIVTANLGGAPTAAAIAPVADPQNDRVSRNFYDNDGLLRATLDGEGYLVENSYNNLGKLWKTTAYANVTAASQRANGNLGQLRPATSVDDITSYTLYDAEGDVVADIDSEGYLTEHVQDANGNETQTRRYANPLAATVLDSISATTTLSSVRPAANGADQVESATYDALNRVVTTTNAQGTVTFREYDAVGNVTSITAAHGTAEARTGRMTYDLLGRLTVGTDARGNTTLQAYDRADRLVRSTDENGNVTRYYYNEDGQQVYAINALGEVEGNTYDALGQLVTETRYGTRIAAGTLATLQGGLADASIHTLVAGIASNAFDSRTSYAYNKDGTLASSGDALGNLTLYAYNAFGQQSSVTIPIATGNSLTSTFAYDRRGLLRSTSADPSGINAASSQVHDAFGRVVQSTDAHGNSSSIKYDRLGRQVRVTDALGAIQSTTYDAFDRVLSQTDALGNVTTTSYDSANRTTTMTTPEGITVRTSTNRHGQVASVVDGRGNTVTYTYDANGNLTQTDLPLQRSGKQVFDKANRLIESVDERGIRTVLDYDAADRVLTRTVDPSTTSPAYTGLNLVTRYEYDALGRQTRTVAPGGVATVAEYDLNGQVTRQIVDAGAGKLNLTTTTTYDQRGKTLTVTDPGGTVTRYTYDKLGRRTEEVVDPNGLALRTSYGYDKNDNVLIKTVSNPAGDSVTRYAYDAANRLIYTVDPVGAVTKYDYDANGNVIRKTAYVDPIPTSNSLKVAYTTGASNTAARSPVTVNAGETITMTVRFKSDAKTAVRIYTGAHSEWMTGNGDWQTLTLSRTIASTEQLPSYIDVKDLDGASHPNGGYALFDNLIITSNQRGIIFTDAFDNIAPWFQPSWGNGSLQHINLANPNDAVTNALRVDPAMDQITRSVYDAANRLIYTVDPAGAVTKYDYDANGNVAQKTAYANTIPATSQPGNVVADASRDVVTRNIYDAANRLIYTVDAVGAVTRYDYDANGNVLQKTAYATLPMENVDIVKRFAATIDQETFALRSTASFTVAIAGTYTFYTNSDDGSRLYINGNEIINNDALQAPVRKTGSITLGVGTHTLVQTYFEQGGAQLNQFGIEAGPLGTNATNNFGISFGQMNIEVFDYTGSYTSLNAGGTGSVGLNNSSVGSVLNLVGSLNAVVTDAGQLGRLVVLDPARDQVSKYTYDAANRQTRTTYPTVGIYSGESNAALLANGATGAASRIETSSSLYTQAYYDAAGNIVANRDAAGAMRYQAYDATGQMRYAVDAEGYVTGYVRDALGNVTALTRYADKIADATRTAWGENAPSLATIAALLSNNSANRTISTEYDASGRAVQITEPSIHAHDGTNAFTASPVTKHTYNALGQIIQTQVRKDNTTWLNTYRYYDQRGLEIATIDALRNVTTQRYDAFGNVTERTEYANPLGTTVTIGTTGYTLPGASDKDRTTRFTFDQNNRRVSETQVNVEYSADATGNGVTLYADANYQGLSKSFGAGLYNASDLGIGNDALSAIKVAPGWQVTLYEHGDFKGTTRVITADSASLPDFNDKTSSIAITGSVRANLTSTYQYDAFGNLIRSTDAGNNSTTTYYDQASRTRAVTQATRSIDDNASFSGLTEFTRDAFGNVTQQVERANGAGNITLDSYSTGSNSNDRINSVTYDSWGRAIATTDALGNVQYMSYDANGNLAKQWQAVDSGDGLTRTSFKTFKYDKLGQLVNTIEPGSYGVRIFSDGNYQGSSRAFTAGDYNLSQLGIGNDALSSLSVKQGWTVTLYADSNFSGATRTITANTASLPDFNDQTSSLRITAPSELALNNTQMQYNAFGELVSKGIVGNDVMWPGDLRADQSIVSANGRYQLIMQADGNLVTYDLQNNRKIIWSSGTSNNSGSRFSFQANDGNLVIYKSDGTAIWNAESQNDSESKNGFLRLQNDGNLVLYNTNGSRAIWSSGVGDIMRPGDLRSGQSIASANGRYQLMMQSDGNLVIYDQQDNNKSIWSSGTNNNSGARFSFQASDGNLVIYKSDNTAVWNAGSQGDPASKNGFLRLQNDGNLILCTADGLRAIWNSRTGLNVSSVNLQPLTNIQGDAQSEYFEYNNGGQLWRSNSGDGVNKVMLYDLQGNLTAEIRSATSNLKTLNDAVSANGLTGTRRVQNIYDALGRVTQQKLANGGIVNQNFDRWGNVLRISDARDASWITEYNYNASNQLIQEIKPTVNVLKNDLSGYANQRPITQYFYDYAGNQVSMRDARGNVNSKSFDVAGNVLRELNADGGMIQHAYNAFGNEVRRTDAMNNVTQYEYNQLGKITKIKRASAEFFKIQTESLQDLAPDPNDPEAVTLYVDSDYDESGGKKSFGAGSYSGASGLGIAYNEASSVQVKPGWKLTVYWHANFTDALEITNDTASLPSHWNDDVAAIKVEFVGTTANNAPENTTPVTLYNDSNYGGTATYFGAGIYDGLSKNFSSLKASRYTQVTHLPFEEPELWRRHPQCAEVRSKEFWPPVRHRFCDQGSRLTMQSDGSFG